MKISLLSSSKTNIDILCALAEEQGFQPLEQNKVSMEEMQIVTMCMYSVIMNTLELVKLYLRGTKVKVELFSEWVIEYYNSKYERKGACNRAFYTHMVSWKKYLDKSGELKLFESFLGDKRGRQQVLKLYLKIRKQITKGKTDVLDEINLKQQEIIAILHTLYSEPTRTSIIKKINQNYLSIQQKPSILQLQSTVLCQFLISQFQQTQFNTQQFKISKQNRTPIKPFISKISSNNGIISRCSKTSAISESRRSINNLFQQNNRSYNNNSIYTNNKKQQNSQNSSYCNKLDDGDDDGVINKSINGNERSFGESSPGRTFKSQQIKQLLGLYGIHDQYNEQEEEEQQEQEAQWNMKQQYSNNNQKQEDIIQEQKSQQQSEQQQQQQLPPLKYIHRQSTSMQSITQKYSIDWLQMLQTNQQFKNKLLQKTLQSFSSMGITNQTFYCINPTHQLYQKDNKVEVDESEYYSIQQEGKTMNEIRQSMIKRPKVFAAAQ